MSTSHRTEAGGRARVSTLPPVVLRAVDAARDKKAFDIVVLDLRPAGGFTDYFVICSGANERQIQAVSDAIKEAIATDFGERPGFVEGTKASTWMLLDYFDFIVHIFSRQAREFYDLDRLWGNAVRHDFTNPPSGHVPANRDTPGTPDR